MIRILHVTNAYPSTTRPAYGVFIKEQIESIDPAMFESSTLVVGEGGGVMGYLRHLRGVREAAAGADVVHCHHMLCGVLCLLAGLGSKTIVSFTSDGALNYKGRPAWLGALLFALVSRFSAFNVYKSRVAPRYCAKSMLLPNGVDERVFSPGDRAEARRRLDLPRDGRLVLFVSSSRLDRPEKRLDFFEAVLRSLEERHPGVFRAARICNVPRHQVPSYFRAADVHLLTSDVEGSPNSVKEALACGTPVVGRDVGNVAAMLDGVPGCAVFRDDDALAVAGLVEGALDVPADEVRRAFLSKGLGSREVATRLQEAYVRVHQQLTGAAGSARGGGQ